MVERAISALRSRRAGWLAGAVLLTFGSARQVQAFADDAWVGEDKALHLTASAVLASGGYSSTYLILGDPTTALLIGAVVALVAGASKELHDVASGGDASYRDVAWNLAGTGLGLAGAWCAIELVGALARWLSEVPRDVEAEQPAS